MTDEQAAKINDLSQFCTFRPGSYEKTFVHGMVRKHRDEPLTERQAAFLDRTHHRYREQIHNWQERGWDTWFTRYGGEETGYEKLAAKYPPPPEAAP